MVTPADTARPLEPQLARSGELARAVGAPPAALVFGGAIGLSAFLLFTAEPMVARLAQPVFGGDPSRLGDGPRVRPGHAAARVRLRPRRRHEGRSATGRGAGSLAAYERPGDDFRFYEIDPLIARVAEDPALFTFLQDAQGSTSIRIGDGRLLVADDPDASADFVFLDAFTSDAVPVHLVTAEGLADVARTLRPGGIVAVHVSNRYYDLEPPVAAGL